jgi:Peptidase family M23
LNCFHSNTESSHLENYRMCLYTLLRRTIAGAALSLSFAPTAARATEKPTPLIFSVQDAPVPFTGSDGNTHIVYELWMLNFSSGDIAVQRLDILADGKVIQTLDSKAIATRLQPVGLRDSTGTLAKSTQALLFLHITLLAGAAVPHHLTHRITAFIAAAPSAFQHLILTGGETAPYRQTVAVIHPPLAGDNYVSADSCCDSSRHMRAALGVNNHVWLAQRYAVDWEQLDSHDRIYSGPREKLESYTIFGKPVLAVADATVVSVVDDLPEQTPGKYPEGISLDKADGNSVLLRLDDPHLGGHVFAMYAHMRPGSIRVHSGDKVHTGEVLGLVGNTGNSLAPHLHFQLMAEPSSLASNGLPYAIDSFEVTAQIPSTEAFDEAEANGTPIPHHMMPAARHVEKALPLDQLIISFPDLRKGQAENRER